MCKVVSMSDILAIASIILNILLVIFNVYLNRKISTSIRLRDFFVSEAIRLRDDYKRIGEILMNDDDKSYIHILQRTSMEYQHFIDCINKESKIKAEPQIVCFYNHISQIERLKEDLSTNESINKIEDFQKEINQTFIKLVCDIVKKMSK